MKIVAAIEMIMHTRYSSCIGKTEMYANGAAEDADFVYIY